MMKFEVKKASAHMAGALSALLLGCSDGEYSRLNEPATGKVETEVECLDRKSLTEEEAFLIASEVLDFLPSTRHSDVYLYELDYIVANGATRSVDNDTLAYIFNMKDDRGFAVVSKTERENPVVAFAEEGRFDLSNQILNEAFVDPLVCYLLDAGNIGVEEPPIIEIPIIDVGKPILGASLGQWEPFNQVVTKFHPGFPVGCVAVATAQIALHSMDTLANFHGRTVYLEAIRNALKYRSSSSLPKRYKNRFGPIYTYQESLDSLSEFLYLLSEDLNTSYTEYSRDGVTHKVSLASSGNSRNLLQKLGFEIKTSCKNFDVMEAVDLLSEGCLIYIDGREIGNSGSGHGFVSDGYKTSVYSDGRVKSAYLHIDWGWEGTSNGYYMGEVFESAWGDYNPNRMFAVKSFNYSYLWPPMDRP